MDNNKANVKDINSLGDLKNSIKSFCQSMNDTIRQIDSYYRSIQRDIGLIRQELIYRLRDLQQDLASAQAELDYCESQIDYDYEGRPYNRICYSGRTKVGSLTSQVYTATNKLEKCERIVSRVEREIQQYENRKRIFFKLIEEHSPKATQILQQIQEELFGYLGLSTYDRQDFITIERTEVSIEETSVEIEQASLKLVIYDDNGLPAKNKKVTIYNNENPLSTGYEEVYTDENGVAQFKSIEAGSNKQVYLDGEKVHEGKMTANMEYNKYKKTKITHNIDVTKVKRPIIKSDGSSNFMIDWVSRIEETTNPKGDLRHEETIKTEKTLFGGEGTTTHEIKQVRDNEKVDTQKGQMKYKKWLDDD